MNILIFNQEKKKTGERELPAQFSEAYRPDLIKRAVHAVQSKSRQRYGATPEAGMRHSTKVSKRRRDYKTSYGFGISRVARKVLSKRGARMFWVGAFSPQTRGGRRSHPPKAIKILDHKINIKENKKAIRSALAATMLREVVQLRGHKVPADYPFALDSHTEQLQKTSEVESLLVKLGFDADLERAREHKVRAGKGKMRGRRYQQKKSILLLVSGDCPLLHAAKNIPGVDVVEAKAVNAALLAPGASPGRATLYTEKALELLEKEKLFM